MSGRRIRRLTRPEVLRQIDPGRLLTMLRRFEGYFAAVAFPLPEDPEALDLEQLAVILAGAQRDAPADLIDALFLIDQMASTTGRDAVTRIMADAGHELPPGERRSPADVATEAWLIDQQMLSRAYASQLSTRNRTLQLFLADETVSIVEDPASDDVRASIKQALTTSLTLLDRGDVELFVFRYDGGVRYVVQRGGVFERYGVWNRGQSPTTIGYQPLEYDVVVYDAVRRELAVKRDPPAEQTALREAFSIGLASNASAFSR